jgi:hypothetical protein
MSLNQANQTDMALLVNAIDKRIYQLIRVQFTNRAILSKVPVTDLINAYQQHGQHKIDFTKIYDI